MGKKLEPYQGLAANDGAMGYLFKCLGCGEVHSIRTAHENEPNWEFNNDLEKPTFKPSVRNYRPGHMCHFFITDGQIQFLNDCTHDLKSKTVEMEDVGDSVWS